MRPLPLSFQARAQVVSLEPTGVNAIRAIGIKFIRTVASREGPRSRRSGAWLPPAPAQFPTPTLKTEGDSSSRIRVSRCMLMAYDSGEVGGTDDAGSRIS